MNKHRGADNMTGELTNAQLQFLKRFDDLPDNCVIKDPFAALVLSTSVWTLRRSNPVPKIQISERCYGRRVGDIRRKMRGELTPTAA
jgi:hypothetical protein